jgi:hypothetical protein
MSVASRKAVRAKLAELLSNELVTVSGLVQAVYDYRVGDFGGQSPVVVVSSGGSRRPPFTFQGTKPMYRFMVYVFVVYNTEDGNWTEADAEDALDDIEQEISEVVSANDGLDSFWTSLEVSDAYSETDSVTIGGVEYRREVIEVFVE